jgi:hypothetical protein
MNKTATKPQATKVKNATKQSVSVATKGVKQVVATEKKRVVFLIEGVSGKQLTQAKINANNASKTETKSISFCINQVNKHAQDFLKSFSSYNDKDINPKKLLAFRTENEVKRGTFSVWLVMQLVTRMYKA